MSLGLKLRSLRIKNNNTLVDQSRIWGVSMNSVYRWENDIAVPRKSTMQMIADYYDVPVDWLLADNTTASLVNDVELKLLSMFRQLSDTNQYKVIGYVERICVEEYRLENAFF